MARGAIYRSCPQRVHKIAEYLMRITLLLIFTIVLAHSAWAQQGGDAPRKRTGGGRTHARPNKCSRLYLGASGGLNNNTGFLGASIDVPVDKVLSVELGGGLGTWGNKLFVGGKYYVDPCARGWAFGTGVTYSMGNNNSRQNLQTIYGANQDVVLNLRSQTNLTASVYKYWSLGKQYNRIYVTAGWSFPLRGGEKYEVLKGNPISNSAADDVRKWAPVGLILGAGISFGIL